jgi:5-methylcytosine-specific restriction endonuclease McrA
MRCQWRSLNVKKGKSIRGRISRNVSTRFSAYLRGDGRPYVSKFSIKCLGYTFDTLKQHLESQFRPGMSWDNYGSEWHIDHIVPLSLHEHEDAMTLIKHAWSLNNLMPRWSTTGIALTHGDTQIGNMNKGNKICA